MKSFFHNVTASNPLPHPDTGLSMTTYLLPRSGLTVEYLAGITLCRLYFTLYVWFFVGGGRARLLYGLIRCLGVPSECVDIEPRCEWSIYSLPLCVLC